MKAKKLLLGLLSASVLTLSLAAFAEDQERPLLIQPEDREVVQPIDFEVDPISYDYWDVEEFVFGSFTGIVQSIAPSEFVEGLIHYVLESRDGMPATIVVSNGTYVLDDEEITVGSEITGYYNANAPMIMIYPPQYAAEVVVVESEDRNVTVDIFDEDLLNKGESLQLIITEDTEIVTQDGEAFDGELAGRSLVVIYGEATDSIPAYTSPLKIIVLDEKNIEPIELIIEERTATFSFDLTTMEFLINDVNITEQDAFVAPYTTAQGVLMVPVRVIAEALCYEVGWDNNARKVTIETISFAIGADNYQIGSRTVELGAAPEIYEDRTFVPLSFFTELMGIQPVIDEQVEKLIQIIE